MKLHYIYKSLKNKEKGTILFVPGVMMPGWIWEKQLEYFSREFAVVAIDPRSQGKSEQMTEGHYAYSRAQDIHSVVEGLDLSPLILVGWSIAAAEVLNYAVHFGKDRLKLLILVDGLLGIDKNVSFYESTIDFWSKFQTDRIKSTKDFVRLIFKTPQSEEYYEKLYQEAMKTPTNTVMTLIYNYILQDFRPLLPQVKVPALFIAAEGPRVEYMKDASKKISNCRFEVFENAGHALFVDYADEFNMKVDSFIREFFQQELPSTNT